MPKTREQHGAALLLVLTAVAILTAVGVDLAYNTRVSLQIAANGRDELRATYLAKSAVNLSRLVIHFQQQLNQAGGAISTSVPGAPSLDFRLWEAVPVNSAMAAMFLGGGHEEPVAEEAEKGATGKAPAAESAPRAFGDFEGSFQATIDDEDRKIDLSQLGMGLDTSGLSGAQWLRLTELMKDPKYDFLFDHDDDRGNRFSRNDVIINLKDWVDQDSATSSLTGNPVTPFAEAFGDENYVYDRGSDRYRAKNARFDSLDELYLVGGIGDAFMAAFGDKLTVYLDQNAVINVNTTDHQQLLMNALVMAQPPGVVPVAVLDPTFFQKLDAALALARPVPFMSLSVQQFAMILTSLGVPVQSNYLQQQARATSNAFGSKSTTFQIRGTGTAGQVTKTLEAVVTVDRSRAGALAADLGRVIHWREE